MAYGLKYTASAISKTEPTALTYTVNIYEKDYVGSTYKFYTATSPITLEVLAASDDPFDPIDPIIATQLTLLFDITDFTDELPDFASTDDRKYHVKLYASGTTYLVWQGFILFDGVTLPFTTGRIFLSIPCVDGLALMKNTPYVPANLNVNILEDLSTTITSCLNTIALPDGYNLNYAVNYFSSGMSTGISPFKQTYLPPRNYLNTDGNTYQTCYEVIEKIVKSFGCQIFQSNGEWWIAAVNERAEDQIRYFQTTNANGVETVVTRWKEREILPWQNTTDSPFFFQDNVQAKIVRKGFANIKLKHDYAYASNFISDPLLKNSGGGYPEWSITFTGTGSNVSVTEWVPAKTNAFTLVKGTGFAQVTPIGMPKSVYGDTITIKFDIFQSELTGGNRLMIKLIIDDSTDWYLNTDGEWSQSPSLNYYLVGAYTGASSSNSGERISITTPEMPVGGKDITLQFRVDSSTMSNLIIGNFSMVFNSSFEKQEIKNYATDSISVGYKKEIDIMIGEASPDSVQTSLNGLLLDSVGSALVDWTRLGNGTVYPYLINLLYQQIFNVISLLQINFNASIKNLFDDRTSNGPIVFRRPHVVGQIDTITVYDPTTGSLNVTDKYYTAGACTLNYTEDTIEGTMLQISNVDIAVTPTDTIVYKKD